MNLYHVTYVRFEVHNGLKFCSCLQQCSLPFHIGDEHRYVGSSFITEPCAGGLTVVELFAYLYPEMAFF